MTGDKYGYGGPDRNHSNHFNIIPVVCSKLINGCVPASQLDFLVRLAQLLNWELIDEENEQGEENVVLWSPLKARQ